MVTLEGKVWMSVDKIDKKKINHIIIQHHYIDVFNIVTFIAIITIHDFNYLVNNALCNHN